MYQEILESGIECQPRLQIRRDGQWLYVNRKRLTAFLDADTDSAHLV